MYNAQNELFITNFNELKTEAHIWNAVIEKSIVFLELLNDIEEDNYFSAKYIFVLNGKRNLDDSYREFKNFIDLSISNQKLENYKFHKLFKRFMTDVDSCLDYMDKLFKELKLVDNKFNFNRKSNDIRRFSDGISNLRNSLLHEGLPKLENNFGQSYSGGCHAHTSGFTKIETSVTITFTPKGSTQKETHEVISLVNRYYSEISRIMNKLTKELIEDTNSVKHKFKK